MKTKKDKESIRELITPIIFALMILMQAYFLFNSGSKFSDINATLSILVRIALPILFIGLLLLLMIFHMHQLQLRINRIERLIEYKKSPDDEIFEE